MENKELSFWWKEGFYDYPIEGGVEITAEHWQSLLKGQENGKQIVTGEDGYPILIDPPEPTAGELAEQEIGQLKTFLAQTDWICSKCYELELSVKDQYPELLTERRNARIRISELQSEALMRATLSTKKVAISSNKKQKT